MGEAFVLVHGCLLSLATLEGVIAKLLPEDTREDIAQRIPFPDALADLEKLVRAGASLRPKKVAGFWMIHTPKDDELA